MAEFSLTMRSVARKKLAVSLFAGAGGIDLGVASAGFHTACSIEVDPHCAATLRRNARGKVVWQVDIRALSASGVADALGLAPGQLSLLHGGPPCQPFSQIGKQGGIADPRGQLVFEMVRFTEALRPAAVLMEQVPQFLSATSPFQSSMQDALSSEFRNIGYDLYADILDAHDYGVAQHRRRALVVCVPIGTQFAFPRPSTERKTVGDVIDGLPKAVFLGDDPLFPNHIDVTPPRDKLRISYVSEGGWLSKSDAPPDILRNLTRKDTTKFRRVSRELPCITLRGGEALYHPLEDRYLTPRETARIQGFPDSHILEGPIRRRSGSVRDLDQHRQIANAVPPPLARAVARQIAGALCLE